MGNSIFIAKILGPYIIIAALGLLFNLGFYKKVIGDFFRNNALIYLGGIMALLIGLLVVLFHNVWASNWKVIITIFGWCGILKGIWLIIFPNTAGKLVNIYQRKTSLLVAHSIIMLAVGVFLTVKGYFLN